MCGDAVSVVVLVDNSLRCFIQFLLQVVPVGFVELVDFPWWDGRNMGFGVKISDDDVVV